LKLVEIVGIAKGSRTVRSGVGPLRVDGLGGAVVGIWKVVERRWGRMVNVVELEDGVDGRVSVGTFGVGVGMVLE